MMQRGAVFGVLGLLFATVSNGVRLEAEVFDELATNVKHKQNPVGVAAIFDMMSVRDTADVGCGAVLEQKVVVSGTFAEELATATETHFSLCDGDLCVKGSEWQSTSTLDINEGKKVVSVNGVQSGNWSFEAVQTAINGSSSFDVGFDVGFDLTGCWNGILDMEDHMVCGKYRYAGLSSALESIGESDNIEEDLSKIVHFNLRVISEEELSLLKEAAAGGLFSQDLKQDSTCFRSALTPICAVTTTQGESGQVHWLAERKLELVGETEMPVEYWSRDPIKEMSLAGPEASFRTSVFRSKSKWHRRDAGFRRAFKKGFQVDACGSRDATAAIQRDANMLANLTMTGYQLKMRFYSPTGDSCGCDPKQARWPLMLTVKPDDTKTYRIALSIQNYMNQKIRGWFGVLSDKRKPEYYYESWFTGMWPSYFHLPEMEYDILSNSLQIAGNDSSEDLPDKEIMRIGDRVQALTSMWWDGSCWYCDNEKVVIDHQYRDGFCKQVYQKKMGKAPSKWIGKNHQVLAGSMGTIKEVYTYFPVMEGASLEEDEKPSFAVEWDDIQELKKFKHDFMPAPVFRVFPWQVVGVPRAVVFPTTTVTSTSPPANQTNETAGRNPNGGVANRGPVALLLAALGLVVLMQ